MLTIGFVINPLAGIGGSVGLKGSDGEAATQALAKGAQLKAQDRAKQALQQLQSVKEQLQFLCFAAELGESLLAELQLPYKVVGSATNISAYTAQDTKAAAATFAEQQVDLIVFVGGDGTARDVYSVIGESVPVLGIPSGVKMHSGVFTLSPNTAGEVIRLLLAGDMVSVSSQEVRDIDEEAYRQERVNSRYYGEMLVPDLPRYLQATKISGREVEELVVNDIAADVVADMDDDVLYLVGAGTTMAAVMEELGLPNSLLGVDVVRGGELLLADASEQELLTAIKTHQGFVKVLLTATGGQGFLLGRGNQQLSPDVIRTVGKDNIQILATKTKLQELDGRSLLVDTGERELDKELAGLYSVITGYHDRVLYSVEAA